MEAHLPSQTVERRSSEYMKTGFSYIGPDHGPENGPMPILTTCSCFIIIAKKDFHSIWQEEVRRREFAFLGSSCISRFSEQDMGGEI